jgi:hypothetical protein
VGCQSLSSDPIIIGNVTPATITHVDNTLIASSGTSFQWFSFGQPIPGATKQILEINLFEVGIYSVEITQGNCTSLSEDFIYLITDAESDTQGIKVFPNPVTEILTIDNTNEHAIEFKVHDALGRTIVADKLKVGENMINVNEFANGIYWVVITTQKGSRFFKIMKL